MEFVRRKEGRKEENWNWGIKFWVTIERRKWQIHFQCRDTAMQFALHSACTRGHHPDTRFPIIIVFKSGVATDSRPRRSISSTGRARSREGVSRKSAPHRVQIVSDICFEDRITTVWLFSSTSIGIRGSIGDHALFSLSLSRVIFFCFGIYWRFEVAWSDFWLVLERCRWLVFLGTTFVSKLVFCCCNWKWNGTINIWEMKMVDLRRFSRFSKLKEISQNLYIIYVVLNEIIFGYFQNKVSIQEKARKRK